MLDLVAAVLRHWRVVAGAVALTVVGVLALDALGPRNYTAQTLLMPAPSSGDAATQSLAGQLSAGILGLQSSGSSSNPKMIEVLVRSRSMSDSVVARLGIAGTPEESRIRTILAEQTDFKPNPDGSIVIAVRAEDPKRAAEVANLFPPLINTLVGQLGMDAARRRREFLETQLVAAREQLERSEQAMLSFQQTQDAPELQDQARQTLQAAATLQQEIMAKEIEVVRLRRSSTPDNPELRAAITDLEARRAQLRALTSGSGGHQVFVPLDESPELKVDATRLLREYTKDEQVYLTLTTSLAQASIDANRNLPVLSVLDRAVEPGGPSGLGRLQLVVLAVFLGLVFGIAAALIAEYLQNARTRGDNRRFFEAWEQFKQDVASFRPQHARPGVRSSVRQ